MVRMPRWLAPFTLSLMTLAAAPGARAEAPQVLTQVPGYYRQMIGAFEVTALYDGQINLDAKLLKHTSPDQVQKLLARMFRTNPTPTAVIAFLVNTGNKLVLVDTGAAKVFGPTLGQVLSNIKAAGYDPAQIDTVLITHMHGDHVGGLLTPDGQVAFPNAQVYAAKADADYWLSAENLAKAPEGMKMFFKAPQDATAPYIKAGHFKTFEGDAELQPGIKPVDEHGHTPGHTGYLFESKGQKLLVWGDVVHNAAVQFPLPKVTIEFDTDQSQALAARLKLFAWTAKDALPVAGAHLPFPGIGHVRADGKGSYSWVPVDFAPVDAKPAK
ncbi:MAG: MBL fold metallo-hydrolase [Burkholderiales bacterium]|nr:MAG: MBL fold metallo-hydrolase [Burkholderiales bacterium]